MAISLLRFGWLVLLPTACASAAWVFLDGDYDLASTAYVVLCLAPVAGLVPVLVHAGMTRDWIVLLPNIPFALAAAGFGGNWLQVRAACIAEPDCNPIPVIGWLSAMVLPVLALGGAVFAVGVSGRTRPGPASR